MKRILILLLMMLPCAVMAQEAKQDSLKLLFVGNSYTYYNDLPKMVYEIAKTQKKKLSVTSVTKGGERLKGHLKNEKLRKMLTEQKWDFVILQEQSSAPAKQTETVIADIYPAAKSLDSLIHIGSPEAKTIFYMTWGHKNGTTHKIDNYPLVYTYQGMQERIKTTYLEMTYQNNAVCAPVGMAWQRVHNERPDYQLYTQDCSHPSKLGSYLAANVIYMVLFGQPYQTDYTAELDSDKAEYIQQTAQKVVLENLDVLNIKR
ncbi:MAG: SGNH/GDSL hydrolase family protein [Alistipes sp.]|nr:SGNH/GDSL hydrolase family protein [Alistipes sp.]